VRRFVSRTAHAACGAFAGRFRALGVLLAVFVAFNTLVRVGLAIANGDASLFLPWRILPALAIGAAFDVVVASGPLALVALGLVALRRHPRALAWGLGVLLAPLAWLVAFVGAAEFVFWNEFASRFNFIAVDYLIYSNEVIGNLRESYDMPRLLALASAVALALWALATWRLRAPLAAPLPARGRSAVALAAWLALPFAGYSLADADYKEFSGHAQLNELAGNGYFDFWHALRTNQIDYDRYYLTLPPHEARLALARELGRGEGAAEAGARPFERDVAAHGPRKELNVVLVSIESLSAEFMHAFGDTRALTPNLDRLGREGLLFTQMYATGTRTVRGLEALSLSVPPTPGHSIVKRPHNDRLFTLGGVFRQHGYDALFLYGGYGYFDNMNAFFSGNGYTVLDRTALAPGDIHFENIWGVADEDLYALALREFDRRHAAGTRFFAHVMTTSNHRPFTYPEGRIDIAPRSGREGGVKYSDWAIGRFIEQARSRPWFDDTLFVFVADHTHKGRGRQELPVENYHIPCIVYAPAHVRPRLVTTLASQIDVGPTLLGLLGIGYRSKFFGHDILHEGQSHPRALLANYQTVGYYGHGRVVELKPNARYRIVDAASGKVLPMDDLGRQLLDDAIGYYQVASQAYRTGELRLDGR